MVPPIKILTEKHEDMSLVFRILGNKAEFVAPACNPSMEKAETDGSGGLPGQPAWPNRRATGQ